MPVAMITTSASRSSPSLNRRRAPVGVLLHRRQRGARCGSRRRASGATRRPASAPCRSIIRGQDLGRDLEDRQARPQRQDRVQDREGDEAGAHHHHVAARPDLRDHAAGPARASRSCARRGRPRPGTGARTADEPVAIRRSSYSSAVPSSSVSLPAFGSSPAARRPMCVVTPSRPSFAGRGREDVGLGDGAAQVVRQDHPRVGPLGRDQHDLRALALLLPDRVDRVVPGGAAADDDVARRHQCLPFPPARASVPAARVAAKSPSQSAVSASS